MNVTSSGKPEDARTLLYVAAATVERFGLGSVSALLALPAWDQAYLMAFHVLRNMEDNRTVTEA